MSFADLFIKGGPVMMLILLCSLFSLALVLQKFFYLRSIEANVYLLKTKIFDLLKQNKIKEAVIFCENSESPVSKILKSGIVNFGSSREVIKEAMENESHIQIPLLERNLSLISTIASLSPLLGLLGTVLGIANSFYVIQIRTAALNPMTTGDIAGGIWQALLTTIFGLMVAIPTTVAFNYFVVRVQGYVLEMERAAGELIVFVGQLTEARS